MQACSVFRNPIQIYNTNRLFARTAVDKSIVRMDCCLYFCSILLNMSKIKNTHFLYPTEKKVTFTQKKRADQRVVCSFFGVIRKCLIRRSYRSESYRLLHPMSGEGQARSLPSLGDRRGSILHPLGLHAA